MATYDSEYYYKKYKTKKAAAKEYKGNIEDLETIRRALAENLGDEIYAVNREIGQLMDDLKDGVRHNSTYTNRANNLAGNMEKAATQDSKLAAAIREIDEELTSLRGKYNQAVSDRDYYKRKCKEKMEEEGKPSWAYWF